MNIESSNDYGMMMNDDGPSSSEFRDEIHSAGLDPKKKAKGIAASKLPDAGSSIKCWLNVHWVSFTRLNRSFSFSNLHRNAYYHPFRPGPCCMPSSDFSP